MSCMLAVVFVMLLVSWALYLNTFFGIAVGALSIFSVFWWLLADVEQTKRDASPRA